MSAPGPIHQYKNVSAADWDKLSAAAEEKFGVAFTGDLGTIQKDGVELTYAYNSAAMTATAQILKRRFLDPSEDTLDRELDEWVATILGPEQS